MNDIYNDLASSITQYQTQLQSLNNKIISLLQQLQEQINKFIEFVEQTIKYMCIEKIEIIEEVFLYCQPYIENKIEDCIVLINNYILQFQTQQGSANISTQMESQKISDCLSTQEPSGDLIKVVLKQSIKQEEMCCAIAFNKQNSIIILGCGEHIKIWKIINGNIQNDPFVLFGHEELVTCLVYCKDERYFISGSDDGDIRLWKKTQPNVWQSTKLTVYRQGVLGVLFIASNQQIISYGKDPLIHIIQISGQNTMQITQTLNKHNSILNCICINESESILASSDNQKLIMIWEKDENAQWKFKQIVNQTTNDYFCRMTFLNNYLICQQWSKPISQVFIEVNGQFIQRHDLQITLSNKIFDEEDLFPTIYNKKQDIIIQKHGKYVYILKQQKNSQFTQMCQPIDCLDQYNYGNLNEDGNCLIIWNYKTKEIRRYELG